MTVDENIKIIHDKIQQNKGQYNLDRQTAKISALSSGVLVNNKDTKSDKDILPEKDLLEKADFNIRL